MQSCGDLAIQLAMPGVLGSMFDKSYVKSTGQMWKFYLFFGSFPALGLASVFLALNGVTGVTPEDANLFAFLVIFGLSLALSGFVLGVLTVKCPKCKARLLWKAVKEQSSQNWFFWLMGLETCPMCKSSYRAG